MPRNLFHEVFGPKNGLEVFRDTRVQDLQELMEPDQVSILCLEAINDEPPSKDPHVQMARDRAVRSVLELTLSGPEQEKVEIWEMEVTRQASETNGRTLNDWHGERRGGNYVSWCDFIWP